MSSDLSDRQWRFYVDDMLGFCDRVLRFNAIDLPDRITGELNPNNDLFALAKELLT
jgi:hypothetical protein